jgi:hypothetical protein
MSTCSSMVTVIFEHLNLSSEIVKYRHMKKFFTLIFLTILCIKLYGQDEDPKIILWEINRLDTIGGHPVTIYGDPIVIETDSGAAVEFDGIDDGLLIGSNPIAGAKEFSIEVVFKPYPGGLEEQRFIHMEQDNDNRALIELRSTPDDNWFLDTFIKSGTSGTTLFAENFPHETNEWWHACLVYKDDTMKHYVNGVEELSGEIFFQEVSSGNTSLGVRQNLVSWYKGAIKTLKVTHKALLPEEFLYNEPITPPVLNLHEDQNNNNFNIFPNPVNSEATITYNLSSEANVLLEIYNFQYEEIMSLANGKQSAGNQQVKFKRGDFPAGLYFCILQIDQVVLTKKLMLLN